MHTVEVRNKPEIEEFLRLPYRIYASDPNWIPHLRQDIEAVFDKKLNKFWRHGEAVRWILKDDAGQTIGRVAAFVN